jgi:hypothetical protein
MVGRFSRVTSDARKGKRYASTESGRRPMRPERPEMPERGEEPERGEARERPSSSEAERDNWEINVILCYVMQSWY